jgi:large subunit ribosomal protein L4
MPTLDVKNISGDKVGDLELDDAVFAAEVHEHLLWETVKWQQAKKRRGTHKVKGRSEVSGTTKKPYRQKGTGRARAGSHKSPVWVGGGSVWGPRPRDYSYSMPKKARKQALRSALSLRVSENSLIVLDSFPVADGKTRNVVGALKTLGAGEKVLIVDTRENEELVRGSRNLANAKWLAPEGLNVYDVLNHKTVVITSGVAKQVEAALKP